MVEIQHKAATEDATPLETIKLAREMWLTATTKTDLDQVENLYRQALTSKTSSGDDGSDEPTKKKRKYNAKLSQSDYRQASEKLALLLCQSGRCKKAKKPLASLGFKCRLAERVLDYPTEDYANQNKAIEANNSIPCQLIDDFLSELELQRLQSVFSSPSLNYWTVHKYQVEPPSPYFSYVIPLSEIIDDVQQSNKFGFIGNLVNKILSCPMLNEKFPSISETKYVEMWAHNRPHASGHQMHFDSDDEGRGGVRNPIISTILYITAEDNDGCTTGGPSLVTNQKISSDHLATRGWLAHPKPKRLVAFDGRYLHGVVPGKGVSLKNSRRVTLMFAFWKEVKVRRGIGPGSARPFPVRRGGSSIPVWAKELTYQLDVLEAGDNVYEACKETAPIELKGVYERLDGKPWKKPDVMPSYDEVFQGF